MAGVESFDGLVAVITGGASGIGRGIAEALIAEGATVVIADIEAPVLEQAATEMGVEGIRVDVSKSADIARLADAVIARHGRVDVVVNNAGVGLLAPFAQLTQEDFRWMLDVNLWGVLHGMTTFIPLIQQTSSSGWVVNTASMAGLFDVPGMAAYAASKFAVVAASETVAQELAQSPNGPGVSIVLPGLVNTGISTSERNRPGGASEDAPPQLNQVPPGRVLEPREVGDLVVAGIRRGDLYIVTHPEMLPIVRDRHAAIEKAFNDQA